MKCPYCGSENVVKNGSRYNRTTQCYSCHNCGKQSIIDRKYSIEFKWIALQLYYKGFPQRTVAKLLDISSHTLINYWDNQIAYQLRINPDFSYQSIIDHEKYNLEIEKIKTKCETKIKQENSNCGNSYYKKCLETLAKIQGKPLNKR